MQFSLVYNNLFVFLESVDEPQPTYDCGQLMQGSSTVKALLQVQKPKHKDINNDNNDVGHIYKKVYR